MLKTKLKFHFKLVIAVILTLGLSISIQSGIAAWQAPSATPPSQPNIYKPINTGMTTQDKTGSLGVGGDLTVLGNINGTISVSNRTAVGMDHNILFNAVNRYTVTQSGPAPLNLDTLFDGKLSPSYTSNGPSLASPQVILIEGLPNVHTQAGSWVGWTTRYWGAKRFKVEGYDIYAGANVWKTFADYSATDYSTPTDFLVKINSGGTYEKLRFTFYEGTGIVGGNGEKRLGVSELLFIQPEAGRPYSGMLPSDMWEVAGSIGVGTKAPSAGLKLDVEGKIGATEYCDEDGNNCVDVSTGMGGGVGGAGGVPKNAVVAFNSLTCPTDWQVADGTNGTPDLRGRFIRGLDSGGSTNDPDSPRTLRSVQNDEFKSHTHKFKAVEDGSGFTYDTIPDNSVYSSGNRDVRRYNTTSAGGSETRPVNIALTYCVKMTDPVASGGTFREILSNPVLMASGDNATVPLTTLNVNNYVSVPSWATSVILRGWSNVGHNKSVRMYINGQTAPFVDTNSGNGDMSDTNSETFIMSGTSITYSVTMSSQWSHYKLWVVGFEGPSSGGGGGASIDTASCYTKEVSTSNYVVECNPGDVLVGIRHNWSYGDDASGSGLENIKCCPFN